VGKKLNLPLFEEPKAEEPAAAKKKPSIDAARARLGGRVDAADGSPKAGQAPGVIVSFALPTKPNTAPRRLPGVIVFASGIEVHVLLDGMRLRRLPPADLLLHEDPVGIELEKLAADARLFGLLVEGQSVRYADDSGALLDGKVVEKCRWGALVLRDDGAVIAVGFRKLWPAAGGGAA
jgi:hypothetical protein